jgi:hypothetical protein
VRTSNYTWRGAQPHWPLQEQATAGQCGYAWLNMDFRDVPLTLKRAFTKGICTFTTLAALAEPVRAVKAVKGDRVQQLAVVKKYTVFLK